ncbi:hypothetical protein SEA_PEGGYLEG03_65 [Arthrobacter phage PeggyLeg03]|nr:hypothetical protein SEA_PEGGYLEG03_65 [Arthrobacter phage PeggyLeg03]
MSDLGYVVIQFNQASHQPDLAWEAPHLFEDEGDAKRVAEDLREQAKEIGRRERYLVAVVVDEEGE